MRAFCLSIYGLRSLCRNERIRRIPNLFLQLETFLEGFADAFGHFIVAVSVSIEGDGIGKTLPAIPEEASHQYPREDFTVENAAKIPCRQVLGSYIVRFER